MKQPHDVNSAARLSISPGTVRRYIHDELKPVRIGKDERGENVISEVMQ